jgi:hypothetical protein
MLFLGGKHNPLEERVADLERKVTSLSLALQAATHMTGNGHLFIDDRGQLRQNTPEVKEAVVLLLEHLGLDVDVEPSTPAKAVLKKKVVTRIKP